MMREQVSHWQLIDTAPRGGKWVLLWWPFVTDAPFVGYLVGDKWHAATGGDTWQVGPTHWMPLPAPPVCEHNWVSCVNEVIESGEFCPKCSSIRAAPLFPQQCIEPPL
jgi:hypothetical protein